MPVYQVNHEVRSWKPLTIPTSNNQQLSNVNLQPWDIWIWETFTSQLGIKCKADAVWAHNELKSPENSSWFSARMSAWANTVILNYQYIIKQKSAAINAWSGSVLGFALLLLLRRAILKQWRPVGFSFLSLAY